jgi:hypothetical protein
MWIELPRDLKCYCKVQCKVSFVSCRYKTIDDVNNIFDCDGINMIDDELNTINSANDSEISDQSIALIPNVI